MLFSNLIFIWLIFHFLTKRNIHDVTMRHEIKGNTQGGKNVLEKSRTPLKRKIVHLFHFFFSDYFNKVQWSCAVQLETLFDHTRGYSVRSTVPGRGRCRGWGVSLSEGCGDWFEPDMVLCSGRKHEFSLSARRRVYNTTSPWRTNSF